ncbi:MAG: hypothetical protein H0X25_17460 [Acidobacteriales bacterium]|nr:hypothetical protein [Terriglobales bacterium]
MWKDPDITGLEAHAQASFLRQRVSARTTDSKEDARKPSDFARQHSIVDLEAQEQTSVRLLNSLRQDQWHQADGCRAQECNDDSKELELGHSPVRGHRSWSENDRPDPFCSSQ